MKNLQGNRIATKPYVTVTPMSGVLWGLIAGLAGTVAMDLALMGGLPALGLPIDTCYLTIGRTAARFFSILGVRFAGDVMLGVAVYHLLGPLLGAIYGLVQSRVRAFQWTTLGRNLICAVLYAEVVSQLILITVPIFMKLPAGETVLWFAGSSVLHAIWGLVVGLAAYYMVQLTTRRYLLAEPTGGISWKIRR